jgi:two-component system, sensor histidine kinase YesM
MIKRIYCYLENTFKVNKIARRLFGYFVITTFIMGITSLLTFNNAKVLIHKVDDMFFSNVNLNEMYYNISEVESNLESYLNTKSSDSLIDYIRYSDELRKKAELIKKGDYLNCNQILLNNISNMSYSYLEEADIAVNAKRGRNVTDYIEHYNEASKIANYINSYISKIILEQFQGNTNAYISISKRLEFIQTVNIGTIFGAVLFNILLIMWFTLRITKPIIGLAKSANQISGGDFEVEKVIVDTDDELRVMADAFNRMLSSIKDYIDEIKEKALLESKLKEQEMQNLKINHLLKEAELKALQSQINPHFIFNTLNAGVQLAMLEGADKTSTFIENVADLLRYNLRKMDRPVTLRDEISNIEAYIYILKTRFGDSINYEKVIDTNCLNVKMPGMILQPIVENAFFHGISEMDEEGRITLKVEEIDNYTQISVIDNGKGMESEKVKMILFGSEEYETEYHDKRHASGIGMANVITRLKLFFGTEDVVKIISSKGQGTKIIIQIPVDLEVY